MLTAGANITITTDGEISATDTDTVYTHPTTAGNKHIPSGGAAGQFLRYSASGTAVMGNAFLHNQHEHNLFSRYWS